MSYLVLARKYRPQVFDDVVGQAHVTNTLANAISADRVAHAYLFCGPRGVGKTTAARILAKALNCEKGPAPVPCNACSACEEITGGRSLDVLEIDGASNRGINEVRELRENTRYAAAGGRSKVYIIDEVHMLTNEAFNALLKTLEEPPAHVVFVLATTEPFKVPGTILSRCQRFDFARIPSREIARHLEALMKEEGVEVAPEAASLVARRAQGGLRDALSLMDQIISAADGAIDRASVERILGLVGGDFYQQLVERLADQDAAGALELLHQIYTGGADLGDLAEGLATHLRDLMLVRMGDSLDDLLDAPESEVPRLKTLAQQFDRHVLVDLVDRAAEVGVALRRSEHPRLTLELALAEMAEAAGQMPLGELTARLVALEARLGGAPRVGSPTRPTPATPSPSPPTGGSPKRSGAGKRAAHPAPKAAPKAAPAGPAGDAAVAWADCLAGLKEGGNMLVWSTLHDAVALGFAEGGGLLIRPAGKSNKGMIARALKEPATGELLKPLLQHGGVNPPRVVLEGAAASPAAPAPAAKSKRPSAKPSPTKPAEPTPDKKTDASTVGELFKEEPLLQKALDMFDGEVLP